ncbi:DUF5753 domain-containing protein [Saccharopolyspora sp. 5N708]|uniref:DUF5753 domain-containing protein n=1 Tax=Saccharopolyspora sp. 5N708 TaxID=3457424 RepID=UPI003FD578D1
MSDGTGRQQAISSEQVAWRSQLQDGHRVAQVRIGGLEQQASVIRGVSLNVVPGLLQTADYARTVFEEQADLLDVPRDLDESVRERLRRQEVLYSPDKRIEILIAEVALLHSVASRAVMAGQVDRLGMALGLPNVRVGLLPVSRQLPHVVLHGYWILDDQVLVENITAELRITDPDQVGIYRKLTDQLWSVAAQGDEARAILSRIAGTFR